MVNTLIAQWRDANAIKFQGNFVKWLADTYKCEIRYIYNTTSIDYFVFSNEKDKVWFLLKV
jgi:hypothetical protein